MIYKINNLSFSYSPNKEVLKNVNLEINEGELITFLGKNGSGKSTLFSLMMGLNKNYLGSILLDSKEISTLKEKDIALISGYVPQSNETCFGYTVFEYVMMGLASRIKMFAHPSKKDEEDVLNILSELKLEEFKDRNYSELSGGEKQQITIARALVSKPKMLIFDEATAHLDYANQIKILKIIKELNEKGYTIALSTHDPNQALLLNKNVCLLDGKGNLFKGTCEEMISEEKLKNIFGKDIKITYVSELKCKVCTYSI